MLGSNVWGEKDKGVVEVDAVLDGSCRDIPTEAAKLSLMEILGTVRLSYEGIQAVRLTE
jgi:hypothetical protein